MNHSTCNKHIRRTLTQNRSILAARRYRERMKQKREMTNKALNQVTEELNATKKLLLKANNYITVLEKQLHHTLSADNVLLSSGRQYNRNNNLEQDKTSIIPISSMLTDFAIHNDKPIEECDFRCLSLPS